MEKNTPAATAAPHRYQSVEKLQRLRAYEVYRMIDVEHFNPDKIMDENVIDEITRDVSATLSKGRCCSRVVRVAHHAWLFLIWHAKNQRRVDTYENDAPASQLIIPRGAILFLVDWTQGLILLSKNSYQAHACDLLQCFTPLFDKLVHGRYCVPYDVDFEDLKKLPYEVRHPRKEALWQHLRLKEARYKVPGESVSLRHDIWEDDAFESVCFEEELSVSEVKEFVLYIDLDKRILKRPISMRLVNQKHVLKAALNGLTLPIVTRTLSRLFPSALYRYR